MERITEDGLFNYATTTGALYDKQCALAREGASERKWYWRVRIDIQRAMVKELRLLPLTDDASIRRAAKCIQEYYEKHVAEG